MLATDLGNIAVYLIAGLLSAIFLLVGRRLIRANKADTEAIVQASADRTRDEMNLRLSALHDDMRDRLGASEKEISGLRTKLAQETGGNNHGMRQAINEIGANVNGVRADLSRLQGSFEQYVTDHAKL